MKSDRGKWKTIGSLLGAAGVLGSIAAGTALTSVALGLNVKVLALIFIFMSVLNLTANIAWLYGIYKDKVRYLWCIIVWWCVPLGLWFLLALIYSLRKFNESLDNIERVHGFDHFFKQELNIAVFGGAVFGIVFYIVAVTVYVKLKDIPYRERSPNPLPNPFKRSNAKYIELETF